MSRKKDLPRGFYFITDSALSLKGNIEDVKSAVQARVSAVQYRNKTEASKDMIVEAKLLRALCADVLFIINDSLDVALKSDADGLHIGRFDVTYAQARRELGEQRLIGVSVHNIEEALRAQEMGADYIGLGPIFATSTKKDAETPCGVDMIYQVKRHCFLPLVAIGGINLDNAKEVVAAGADCLCAISATVTQRDVKKEIDKYFKVFKMDNSLSTD